MVNLWSVLAQTLALSVAALVLLAAKRLFLDKLSPRWQYGVWAILALRALLPAGLLGRTLVPGGRAVLEAARLQVELPLSSALTDPYGVTEVLAPVPLFPRGLPAPGSITDALFYLYAAGVLLLALWFFLSYARLRAAIRRGLSPAPEVLAQVEGVAARYGLKAPRLVVVLPGLESAFVCGPLRPVLALPDRPVDDKVLLHELLHLRHGDVWAGVGVCALRCLHWCNPLLWLAYRLFCRDVEAACDQAVIRPLGREDTARYAATLLHLGCRSGFPAAVPLAFGTEDTKGRIRAVLSYRRPALWLILATAAACLAAGLFLLGDTNGRLEGRPVDEGMVFSYGETLPLPEPLLEELLALCNRYDGDLEPMSSLSFETDTRILLSGKKDHWEIFRGDHPLLVHTTSSGGKDRESQPYRMTGQLEQAYLAWEASLEEYLWVPRPDTLYTRRGCSLQTKQAAEQVLEELNLRAFTGPYTVEVFQGESPDPTILTVYLDTPPVLATDAARLIPYLDLASSALFALDDTLFYIDWTFGAQGSLHGTGSYMTYPDGLSGQDTPPQTQEAFRETYRQMKQAGSAAQITLFGRYRDTEQVLYCAPGYDGPFPLEAGRSHGIFSELWSDVFALTSFSDSQGVHYDTPYYRWQPQAANDQLTRYGVDPAQHQGEARWCIVENVFTQDTGYRLYEWDGNVFLGYTTPGQPAGPLSFLVQLESTPH